MRGLSRGFALAAVVPLILYAGFACSSDEGGSPTHLLGIWIRSLLERERLDSEGAMFLRSAEVTLKIVSDMDEGRLTLGEAAAALRAERESRPAQFRLGWIPIPGESVEECCVREVLREAECRLEQDPRRDEILTRLRAEYHDMHKGAPIRYEEANITPDLSERPARREQPPFPFPSR